MTIAWSCGGGLQSVAIGVLIREGAIPVPDLAGIADTGREMPSTWEYLHEHLNPYLAPVGLAIEIVPHTLAGRDLYGPDGLTLMPAYTRREDGIGLYGEMLHAEGRLPAFCSGTWKRDVMERWLRLKGVKECDQWIGFSLDEADRVKKDHRPWCHLKYPLIEKRISREMCKRLIRAAGLPEPKKSRCWCCPHQSAEEWLEVKARPTEFAAAVALEKAVNESDPEEGCELFLYQGRAALPLADFSRDAHWADITARKVRLFACACCRQVWPALPDQRSRRSVETAERYADGRATLQQLMTAHDAASSVALAGSFEGELAWRCSAEYVRDLIANHGLPRWFSTSTSLAAAQASLLRDITGNPFRPVEVRRRISSGPYGPGDYLIAPSWLTPTVVSLAQAAYLERGVWLDRTGDPGWKEHVDDGSLDPQNLGVLSDAMEEAACDDARILDHFRGEPCPYCKDAKFDTGDYGGPLLSGSRMRAGLMENCTCKGTRRSPCGPHVRGCWCLDLLLGRD